MKLGVTIVECVDVDDPGSEGRMLREVFNLMGVESELVYVTSISELLKAIDKSKMRYVHVSTHGRISSNDKFKGWWTPQGDGTKSAFLKHDLDLSNKAIVSTACKSGAKGFGKYLTEVLNCKCYIAPSGSPKFYNAALFSHIFYHKLFNTKKSFEKAFNSYEKNYKNPHGFKLFQ